MAALTCARSIAQRCWETNILKKPQQQQQHQREQRRGSRGSRGSGSSQPKDPTHFLLSVRGMRLLLLGLYSIMMTPSLALVQVNEVEAPFLLLATEQEAALAKLIVEKVKAGVPMPLTEARKDDYEAAVNAPRFLEPGKSLKQSSELTEEIVKVMQNEARYLLDPDGIPPPPAPFELPTTIGEHTCNSAKEVLAAVADQMKATDANSAPATGTEGSDDSGEAGSGENEDNDKEEQEPWHMTTFDKIMLEIGWLFFFVAITAVLGFVASMNAQELPNSQPEDDELVSRVNICWSTLLEKVYLLISNRCMNLFIGFLSLTNYFVFALSTEQVSDPSFKFLQRINESFDVDWEEINNVLEKCTVVFFLVVTFLRVSAKARLGWSTMGMLSGVQYLFIDMFCLIEVCALVASIVDILAPGSERNFTWLFLCRVVAGGDAVLSGGAGKMEQLLMKDGKLLVTAFVFGLVVWLVMSALYFDANRENTEEDATWKWAVYHYDSKNPTAPDEPWVRFESIPSSMFFVLINLVKEHPLADAHKTFIQRLLACIVCIFAMPIFGLPVAVLQQALLAQGVEEGTQKPAPSQQIRSDASAKTKRLRGIVTAVLVSISVWSFFYYTAYGTPHHSFFWIEIYMSPLLYTIIELLISAAFLVEFAMRLQGSYFQKYMTLKDPLLYIDLIAWFPGILSVILYFARGMKEVPEWLLAFCVVRLFKLERFVHSFRDMWNITLHYKQLLGYTLALSGLLWMFFSTTLYATERSNPDPEMHNEVFGSVFLAMWTEIINLHGEWPWADFTWAGKGVATVIAVFSIMLFCVPISIFGNGFAELIAEEAKDEDHEKDDPWESHFELVEMGSLRQTMYRLFYGHLVEDEDPILCFRLWRFLSCLLVFVTTLVTFAGSIETKEEYCGKYCDSVAFVWKHGYWVDLVATTVWTLEFIGRCIATGGFHVFSFPGVCDIVSFVGFYATLCEPTYFWFSSRTGKPPSEYEVYVLLRLLRMFSPEPYIHAVHNLVGVIKMNWWALARSGVALITIWFIFATLLYLLERPEPKMKNWVCRPDMNIEEIDMAIRYQSILSALQYAIVHLFGDYPVSGYTWEARYCHFGSIILGIAIMSSFTGVFTASFVDYIQEERKVEMQSIEWNRANAILNAVRKMQAVLRRHRNRAPDAPRTPRKKPNFWKLNALNITEQRTVFGRQMHTIFQVVLCFNLLCTMILSLPELDVSRKGATIFPGAKRGFLYLEMLATSLFTYEWIVFMVAHPPRTIKLFLRSWRFFDFLCLLPGIVLVFKEWRHLKRDPTQWEDMESTLQGLLMLRAIRILHFPYFRREVTMICCALADALPNLAGPGFLAVNTWVISSGVFMWLEKYSVHQLNECGEHDNMRSIPETMYWTCIFLTGEWANVDFSWMGSRLCILYVLFGIAVFSMPVGIIVEAVKAELERVTSEEQDLQALLRSLQCTPENLEEKISEWQAGEARQNGGARKSKAHQQFRQSIFAPVMGDTSSARGSGVRNSLLPAIASAASRMSMSPVVPRNSIAAPSSAIDGASGDVEMQTLEPSFSSDTGAGLGKLDEAQQQVPSPVAQGSALPDVAAAVAPAAEVIETGGGGEGGGGGGGTEVPDDSTSILTTLEPELEPAQP